MVRVPAPGHEFECFQIAYGRLRYLHAQTASVGTPAVRTGGCNVEFDVSVDRLPEQDRQVSSSTRL